MSRLYSTINDSRIGDAVERAFDEYLDRFVPSPDGDTHDWMVDVFYEHGQYWARYTDADGDEHTFSVVDSEMPDAIQVEVGDYGNVGFGFEEI